MIRLLLLHVWAWTSRKKHCQAEVGIIEPFWLCPTCLAVIAQRIESAKRQWDWGRKPTLDPALGTIQTLSQCHPKLCVDPFHGHPENVDWNYLPACDLSNPKPRGKTEWLITPRTPPRSPNTRTVLNWGLKPALNVLPPLSLTVSLVYHPDEQDRLQITLTPSSMSFAHLLVKCDLLPMPPCLSLNQTRASMHTWLSHGLLQVCVSRLIHRPKVRWTYICYVHTSNYVHTYICLAYIYIYTCVLLLTNCIQQPKNIQR